MNDLININSIIFLTISTLLNFIILYFGSETIRDITTNKIVYILFIAGVLFIYLISLGMYFMKWSIKGISVIIITAVIFLSIVSYLVIYFGGELCAEVKKEGEATFYYYLLIILEFIVFYLSLHNKDNFSIWTLYDTARIIAILIILRLMYFIVEKYDYKKFKYLLDLTLLIAIFFNMRRVYRVFSGVPTKEPIKN